MTLINEIMGMREIGMTDPQIIDALRERGVSPREIEEALSQSNIKSTIEVENTEILPESPELQSPSEEIPLPYPDQAMQITSPYHKPATMQYQTSFSEEPSSITSAEPMGEYQPELQFQAQAPSPYETESQQSYQEYPEYQAQEFLSAETMNEIAEQMIEEKTSDIRETISAFVKFREGIKFEVDKLNERLAKIENNFHELQMAILGRIGEYGKHIQNISKEMQTTQESFSKIINPLTERARESHKKKSLPHEKSTHTHSKSHKSEHSHKHSKDGFESYLR